MQRLEDKVRDLESRLAEQEVTGRRQEKTNQDLALIVEQLVGGELGVVNTAGQMHNEVIGFSAYHDIPLVWVTYEADAVIPFPGVAFESEFYDNETSTFTCPLTGVYHFTLSANFRLTEEPYQGGVEMVRGGAIIATVASMMHPDSQEKFPMSSISVITTCDEGQEVVNRASVTSRIFGESSIRYTTFSGFLLGVN